MKAVVLGDTGMLGSMVKEELYTQGIEVVGLSRKDGLVIHPEVGIESLEKFPELDDTDYIINCIGAIKPVFDNKSRLTEAIYTNAVFPHELAAWYCHKKIIHITTDCVFDGIDGWYTENSVHKPSDAYGKSKSLGESEDCMVLRTSIVGPEWGGNKRSLVEWLLSNAGGEVNGFTNHLWNGLDIVWNDMYSNGTYHLFSHDIDKFSLILLMNNIWELGIKVSPAKANFPYNRTLRTVHKLNSILKPQPMTKMLEDLTPFIKMDRLQNV
jgi:dTDP-4-dehydrorhamnose reductase